jgi:hypothetical protein
MQARHSVISLAALARCIRRSSAVNNMSAPVSGSFLYQTVAKILVLARRLWAGLLFDELELIAQPLAVGRLRVALVVRVGAPLARLLQVGGDRRGEVAELARRRAVPPLRGRATGYQFLVVPRRGKVVKRKPRAA